MQTKRTKMLSFRVSDDELERVKALAAELIQANKYLTEADVLRELVGFENTGLITKELRQKLLSVKPGLDEGQRAIQKGGGSEVEVHLKEKAS